MPTGDQQHHQKLPGSGPLPNGRVGYLLVVEPETLLRWSLATYLSRWFDVFPTETGEAADRILDDHRVDALVVSDQLSADTLDALEGHARSRNASTRVVRTVTSLNRNGLTDQGTFCIEKPFELWKLANLLGVDVGRSNGRM